MTDKQQPEQQSTMRMSQLKLRSLGVVATPKLLSQQTIEVTPIEDAQFVDGELSDAGNTVTVTGKEDGGGAYEAAAATANTVQATWLHMGQGNRRTAPDVRSGATVALWQFGEGNEDQLYWTTCVDDLYLRRLETVIWTFSATADPGTTLDQTNCYYLEVSTHTGQITLHTTKANGEPFEYTVQLNTKEGKFSLEDDIGNLNFLDSMEHQFKMINTDGSFLDINKKKITMWAVEEMDLGAGKSIKMHSGERIDTDTKSTTMTSAQNHKTEATLITEDAPAVVIAGNLSTKAGRGGSTGSGVLDGTFRVKGSVNADQDLTAGGRIKGDIVESVQDFVGPNV